MGSDTGQNRLLYLVYGLAAGNIIAYLIGPSLFENDWGLQAWKILPLWYPIAWSAILIGMLIFSNLITSIVEQLANQNRAGLGAAAGLFALVIIFQFDSFVSGGGNLRIAQIAQTDTAILRWFEFGIGAVANLLFAIVDLFGGRANTSGLISWKIMSFASTLISIWAATKIATTMATNRSGRFWIFAILFFGPQTILYFGFVGIEPILVAVLLWFFYFSLRLANQFDGRNLLTVWGLAILGIVLHYSLILLLPAVIYLSLARAERRSRIAGMIAGLLIYVSLVALCYYWAGIDREFARNILFVNGINPHTDYGLFSARHIGDVLQTILMASPLAILAVYLCVTTRVKHETKNLLNATLLVILGGLTWVVILSPQNSIIFDFPGLTAYLAPIAFLVAIYVSAPDSKSSRLAPRLAILSILLPLAYIPIHTNISQIDKLAVDYFEKHPAYYRSGCLSFRDAYFHKGELPTADRWEWRLPKKSPEHLLITQIGVLIDNDDFPNATTELYRLLARYPDWTEPKGLLADIMTQRQRWQEARALIDECLELEPYHLPHYVRSYRYYRDIKNYAEALRGSDKALELSPDQIEIVTDRMIIYYRVGDAVRSDSLAGHLIEIDPTLSYPYLIRGFLSEAAGDPGEAAANYDAFVKLNPDEAPSYRVQERLDSLVALLQSQL